MQIVVQHILIIIITSVGLGTTLGLKKKTSDTHSTQKTVLKAAKQQQQPQKQQQQKPPKPVDCEVSGWSTSGTCTKKCGSGTQTRTRQITKPAENGGKQCPSLSDSHACNTQACSSNENNGKWSTKIYY